MNDDQVQIHNPIVNMNYKNFQDVSMKADSRHNSQNKKILSNDNGAYRKLTIKKNENCVNPEDNQTPVDDQSKKDGNQKFETPFNKYNRQYKEALNSMNSSQNKKNDKAQTKKYAKMKKLVHINKIKEYSSLKIEFLNELIDFNNICFRNNNERVIHSSQD